MRSIHRLLKRFIDPSLFRYCINSYHQRVKYGVHFPIATITERFSAFYAVQYCSTTEPARSSAGVSLRDFSSSFFRINSRNSLHHCLMQSKHTLLLRFI